MDVAAGARTPARGPTAVGERALAPDLARGAMLLLIALANAHLFLYGRPGGLHGYPLVGAASDQLVTLAQMTLVDGRAYPMFAALFGYGLVQLARRQAGGGEVSDRVVELVRRRGRWLVVFGLAHGVLLFSGDIIGAYGLLAVMLAGWLLRAPDRTLLVAAWLWLLPSLVVGAVEGLPLPEGEVGFPSLSQTDPLLAVGDRLVEWLFAALVAQAFIPLPAAVIVGVWAARRRLLDEPERHRRLLARTAAAGLALGALGGLPMALVTASLWTVPAWASALASALHTATGYAGGVGYAALAGLLAAGLRQRRGILVTALSACGQRSMTCYLAQSVVFVAVLAAYGGGLGDRLGVATAALLAAATWLLTVAAALVMHQTGFRGPAELLLRRLTYRASGPVA